MSREHGQKPSPRAQEDATDFMIRVGTSVSNLDKDWQGQLSQAELESLQYEVSLNGVRQEIRHVLDSEIARRGPLTPHQMYEAVKKYEMYVARNKRLEGQSSSPSAGQQKTSGQTSTIKPRFHKTTAFAAKVEESEAQVDQRQEAQPTEEGNPSEAESSLDDDDGLYIPSYLEEAAPNDPVLQVRLARAMRAHEKETRRCYRCHQQGHLQKDCKEPEEKNGRGPLSSKGPLFSQIGAGEDQAENLSARSSRASNKPSQVKGTPYLNPDPFCHFIGPRNWGEALIDDKLTTCLLDNGSQLNFVTPTYARERGMDILSLDTLAREIGGQLPPITIMGRWHDKTRRVRDNECTGTLCQRVQRRPDRHCVGRPRDEGLPSGTRHAYSL